MPDDETAAVLASEGHRSANCVDKVLPLTVQQIRGGAGIKLAARLNIPANWLYVQIRRERLPGTKS